MPAPAESTNGTFDRYLVLVRPSAEGQFTAQVVGIPELTAAAANREEAIHAVRLMLESWLASGHLVPIDLPRDASFWAGFGHADPNDPSEQEYLAELARARQEDLERTLREYDQECSDTSSTPTT